MLKLIKRTKERGGTVYVIGNGGSCATAEHFAQDLCRKGVKAVALTNSSVITQIGNDEGFKYIFSSQLKNLATKNDLLIAISVSGQSDNILEAIEIATELDMRYFLLTAYRKHDYEEAEDEHMELCHLIIKQL